MLSITVLDRAASTAQDDREDYSYMAEAEPLLCTHWGVGGRTARRVCAVAAPEAVLGFGAKVTAVQLTVSWAPEMRLKKPFSLVAAAGGCTRTLLSSKVTVDPPWIHSLFRRWLWKKIRKFKSGVGSVRFFPLVAVVVTMHFRNPLDAHVQYSRHDTQILLWY